MDLDATDDEILAALQLAESESLPTSQWGRALAREVITVKADNAKLRAELAPLVAAAAIARTAARRAWLSMGGAGAILIAAAGLLWATAGARGEARGDERAERARLAADHAEIVKLRDQHDRLYRDHAELVGLVRGLYPFRALPVYGPAPAPSSTVQFPTSE